MTQLDGLVEPDSTVIVVEQDMSVIGASDWVIDIGPRAGNEGGRVVAEGVPEKHAGVKGSRTVGYLKGFREL